MDTGVRSIVSDRLEADGYGRGCLIGDLSLEASGSSELLRAQLEKIFQEWREEIPEFSSLEPLRARSKTSCRDVSAGCVRNRTNHTTQW